MNRQQSNIIERPLLRGKRISKLLTTIGASGASSFQRLTHCLISA